MQVIEPSIPIIHIIIFKTNSWQTSSITAIIVFAQQYLWFWAFSHWLSLHWLCAAWKEETVGPRVRKPWNWMKRSLERISNVQKRASWELNNRRRFMNTLMKTISIKEYLNMQIEPFFINNHILKLSWLKSVYLIENALK
jgi:hypothetical protein